VKLEPWAEAVLRISRFYRDLDIERRRNLLQAVSDKTNKSSKLLEGRVDLTALPCVCVDARTTSFPDDAIGVRLCSSTGRKVFDEASKWEVLIHITDISDIYCPKSLLTGKIQDLGLLHDAAARRGTSRYDLPLGPLHLTPPTVLEVLALQVNRFDEMSKVGTANGRKTSVNRCLTLWAYIDERNGKLIDAGLERMLISVPLSLSFVEATLMLEGELNSPDLKQARAVLAVAERNLNKWSGQRRATSEAARKRESHLSAREMVAKE
jgi:hypothetical protein